MVNTVYDHETEFTLKDGRKVTIKMTWDGEEIFVCDAQSGVEVGKVELQEVDGEFYRLTWMYLDGANGTYLKQGIGRKALQFLKDTFGLPIVTAEDDGIQRSDGSHLTGDAPGFVRKMVQEGVIYKPRVQAEDYD